MTELPEMTAEDKATLAEIVGKATEADPGAPVDTSSLAERLGGTMLKILATSVGQEAAEGFARQIVTATLPGTAERAAQDKAWAKLENRLIGAQKENG